MTDKLARWLTFSVAFAAFGPMAQIPLLYTDGRPVSLDALFGQGELLMVVVGVCLSAVGELLAVGPRRHGDRRVGHLRDHLRTLFVGANLIWALMASAWYGDVTGHRSRHAIEVRRRIVTGSLWMFVGGLAFGAIGIWVLRKGER